MSMDSKTKLLLDVLNLFERFGVQPGKGIDGELMARIQAEVSTIPDIAGSTPPMIVGFNPNAKIRCPLCKAPDFNECGCPADEQMAAMI